MGLVGVDVYNYLILGSSTTIERVLAVGLEANMDTNKYAWYAMTKDNLPEVKCKNCKGDVPVMYMHPTMTREHVGGNLKVADIRRNFGVDIGSDVDVAFYFNVGLSALKAVR